MVRFHQVDDGVNETKQQLSGMLAPTLALQRDRVGPSSSLALGVSMDNCTRTRYLGPIQNQSSTTRVPANNCNSRVCNRSTFLTAVYCATRYFAMEPGKTHLFTFCAFCATQARVHDCIMLCICTATQQPYVLMCIHESMPHFAKKHRDRLIIFRAPSSCILIANLCIQLDASKMALCCTFFWVGLEIYRQSSWGLICRRAAAAVLLQTSLSCCSHYDRLRRSSCC